MKARYVAALLGVSLVLGGCGTDRSVATQQVSAQVEAGDRFNETDVMYLQMMVSHHEQGLEMVRIAEATIVWSSAAKNIPAANPEKITRICRCEREPSALAGSLGVDVVVAISSPRRVDSPDRDKGCSRNR